MKLTKYDYLQLLMNVMFIAGAVLDFLFLTGTLPQWVTFIGLTLAIGACLCTNILTTKKKNAMRAEVSGIPFLAGLTYATGFIWLISYGLAVFSPMSQQ